MICREVIVLSNEETFILSSETHYEAHEYVNIEDMKQKTDKFHHKSVLRNITGHH